MVSVIAATRDNKRERVLKAALLATAVLVTIGASAARAAVGCSLNDPDRDVVRLFPTATSYRTEYVSIASRGGDELAARIEEALGDTLDPVFESLDVDYAYYTVLSGTDTIGRVHGVNQKGMYGGMQLILATDPSGTIVDFYYQKLSSPESKRFRDEAFTSQFDGLALDDLLELRGSGPDENNDGSTMQSAPGTRFEDPSEESSEDFEATVRGITKNLLLLHAFFGIGDAAEQDSEGGTR